MSLLALFAAAWTLGLPVSAQGGKEGKLRGTTTELPEQNTTTTTVSAPPCCISCTQGVPGFCSPVSRNCYGSHAKDYYQSCPDGGLVPPPLACCERCTEGVPGFCSAVSGNCYDHQDKDYYQSCPDGGLEPAPLACCDRCTEGVPGFCSAASGNCYDSKDKDYYQSCPDGGLVPPLPCCDRCTKGVPGFCSPVDGNCYNSSAKDYYQSCPEGGRVLPPLPRASTNTGSVKFMSYNLMGWNAFNLNTWRGQNVLGKVRAWDPAVLGAQEVEKGGGAGYEDVKDVVVNSTGLVHAGGGQFFSASAVEQNETGWVNLLSGYWMSMTKYKHKASGTDFLFFNSHWKHGHGMEQAEIVAAAIHDIRMKHGSPPTVLVGDTNQFCLAYEQDAIKYLKGEIGASPVSFVDAIYHDSGRSFGADCRVDFILASAGQWSWVQSSIDRDGMGSDGTASDHAALMAELVPQL